MEKLTYTKEEYLEKRKRMKDIENKEDYKSEIISDD